MLDATQKRKELIDKVKEIVNNSELVPESAIEEAQKMDDEQLEKYVILLYGTFVKENQMEEEEKINVKESLKKVYNKIYNIYNTGIKKVMEIKEKENSKREQKQLQQIERQIEEF